MAKIVYGWLVDWNDSSTALPSNSVPRLGVDLFFSSPEKFKELWGTSGTSLRDELRNLIPCFAGDDFNDLDYIPENY